MPAIFVFFLFICLVSWQLSCIHVIGLNLCAPTQRGSMGKYNQVMHRKWCRAITFLHNTENTAEKLFIVVIFQKLLNYNLISLHFVSVLLNFFPAQFLLTLCFCIFFCCCCSVCPRFQQRKKRLTSH